MDTLHYPVTLGRREQFSYDEGKRQAEAVLLQQASFPVAAVRFPFVVGEDDYTERLLFHVRKAAAGKAVQAFNPDARISFISSQEAAQFLFWLGRQSLSGPVNACSKGALSLQEIMNIIERATGKRTEIEHISPGKETDPFRLTPYAVQASYGMNTDKAEAAGFTFSRTEDWFPGLIQSFAAVHITKE
ncbi:hypothetical protein [Paenibacillus caui]|uniref:hypothetical protein n=1 Tax=Paenibacillus caui TaxID=2873927 RepID=UPI001F2A1D9C|nr:hypothetical protein [Paenibacillus caui]